MRRKERQRRGPHAPEMGAVGPAGVVLALCLALGILAVTAISGCTNSLLPIIKALTSSDDGGPGPGPPPTYAVTYHGNGNTGGAVPLDPARYDEGSAVTVLGNVASLVRSGWTFSGWNSEADGTGTACAGGDTLGLPFTRKAWLDNLILPPTARSPYT